MNSMQDEFNAVCEHLVKQGERAYGEEEGMCYYRSPKGLMCAVGCRIPDRVYTTEMEGRDVYNLLRTFKDVVPPEISEYVELFDALQGVHDASRSWTSLTELKGSLRQVANKFNLKIPAVISH